MAKRQALAEYHRSTILAVSERLFAQKGVDKTTMDDIAREAEYSKATLYVYFESKEEIVGAVLINGLTLLNRRTQRTLEGAGTWQGKYWEICRSLLRFYREDRTAYEVILGGGHTGADGGRYEESVRQLVKEFFQQMSGFFAQGQRVGVLDGGRSADELVLFFWGSSSGLIHLADREQDLLTRSTGRSKDGFLTVGFDAILQGMMSAVGG